MMVVGLMLTTPTHAIDNIFHDVMGGTLEYYTTYSNGTLSGQLTSGSATAGNTIYVKAMPDFGYTVKDMTIKATESCASGEADAPRFRAPSLGTTVALTPVSNGLYSFTMPSNGNDVTITATFPEKSKVSASYVATGGTSQTPTEAYVLDGTETGLGVSVSTTW